MLKRNPENHPVASCLLPEDARAPVRALYAFARGADDIADAPGMAAVERRKELLALEEALTAHDTQALPDFALPYAMLAKQNPLLMRHARIMLSALVQDTLQSRYRDDSELLDYCRRAAVPAGAAFFILCGEDEIDPGALEPFCVALQLVNHIRDCGDDYVNRGIVYLPLAWFTFAGAQVHELAASECSEGIRRVLDHAIDHCEMLLKKSAKLPSTLRRRGVAREVAWIHLMTQALCAKLRRRDPLSARVRVGKVAAASCLIRALLRR